MLLVVGCILLAGILYFLVFRKPAAPTPSAPKISIEDGTETSGEAQVFTGSDDVIFGARNGGVITKEKGQYVVEQYEGDPNSERVSIFSKFTEVTLEKNTDYILEERIPIDAQTLYRFRNTKTNTRTLQLVGSKGNGLTIFLQNTSEYAPLYVDLGSIIIR
jgi:hypothetical protein